MVMYAYDNYNKVKAVIEARRASAIAEAETRCVELASISEEIREIDIEQRGTGLLLFKTACAGGDTAPIRERNLALSEMRRRILKRLGYPIDYTEIHYTCSECSDTGYSGTKMCRCFREMLITENIRSSGMGSLIEKQSFENFSLEPYIADENEYARMKHNLAVCREYAENFSRSSGNLLFIGKTGTGKTHLSTAIAKKVIERGYEVLYDSTQNIVSAFETDRFKSGYGPYEPKGDKYLDCDLLILDDLGAEFVNQFTVSCLYNLLNTRQNKGLATIISTNLSPEELARKYEDRIYSRLIAADSTILLFVGKDRRLSKK